MIEKDIITFFHTTWFNDLYNHKYFNEINESRYIDYINSLGENVSLDTVKKLSKFTDINDNVFILRVNDLYYWINEKEFKKHFRKK